MQWLYIISKQKHYHFINQATKYRLKTIHQSKTNTFVIFLRAVKNVWSNLMLLPHPNYVRMLYLFIAEKNIYLWFSSRLSKRLLTLMSRYDWAGMIDNIDLSVFLNLMVPQLCQCCFHINNVVNTPCFNYQHTHNFQSYYKSCQAI